MQTAATADPDTGGWRPRRGRRGLRRPDALAVRRDHVARREAARRALAAAPVRRRRQRRGRAVLEIGAGTGAGLRFFPPGTEVVAVEPSAAMAARARARAGAGAAITIVEARAEELPFADAIVRLRHRLRSPGAASPIRSPPSPRCGGCCGRAAGCSCWSTCTSPGSPAGDCRAWRRRPGGASPRAAVSTRTPSACSSRPGLPYGGAATTCSAGSSRSRPAARSAARPTAPWRAARRRCGGRRTASSRGVRVARALDMWSTTGPAYDKRFAPSPSPPSLFEHTCDVCGPGAGREGSACAARSDGTGQPAAAGHTPSKGTRDRMEENNQRTSHQHHRTLDPLSPPSRLSWPRSRREPVHPPDPRPPRAAPCPRASASRPPGLRGGAGGRRRGARRQRRDAEPHPLAERLADRGAERLADRDAERLAERRRHPRHPRPTAGATAARRGRRQASRARLARTGRATGATSSSLRRAAAHGDWMPIVRDAAQRNHISAIGLRRLMSLESGGRVHAENGSFHGLYQYCWSTWRAAWNPWRAVVAVRRRSPDPRHRRRHPARLGPADVAQHLSAGVLKERSGRRRRGARTSTPPPPRSCRRRLVHVVAAPPRSLS